MGDEERRRLPLIRREVHRLREEILIGEVRRGGERRRVHDPSILSIPWRCGSAQERRLGPAGSPDLARMPSSARKRSAGSAGALGRRPCVGGRCAPTPMKNRVKSLVRAT